MAVKLYKFSILILFILLQGCTSLREVKMLKIMNGKVPSTSKWLGGRDGGVWVNIAILSDNTFKIFVYNDNSGQEIVELTYLHNCANINEKLIFKALNSFADGLQWKANNSITKCVILKEKISKY